MLPHFRRIARKIFGYKQQKARNKHRHAPNAIFAPAEAGL